MPSPASTPLATLTLTSTDSQIDFVNIPANGYKGLVLVADCAVTNNADMGIQINGDAAANYPQQTLRGYETTVNAAAATYDRIYWALASISSTSRFLGIANFADPAATDKHKTVLLRSGYVGGSTPFVEAKSARWASGNAITSIRLILSSGSFAVGSQFSLYGIAG